MGSVVIDGWKTPSSDTKCINLLLFFSDQPDIPYFWRSYVVESNTSFNIMNCICEAIENFKKHNIIIISCITDNAPSMLAATKEVSNLHPEVISLRCASHIVNLIIKKAISDIDFIQEALMILKDYIDQGVISRYVETRWNSVYDKFVALLKYLKRQNKDTNKYKMSKLKNSIESLKPYIDFLNKSQVDGASWIDFYALFNDAIQKSRDRGLYLLVNIAESRVPLI